MKGRPRKNARLTKEQIDYLALRFICSSEINKKDQLDCGIERTINHDERDIVYHRAESLGTELLTKHIKRTLDTSYNEYR